LYPDLITEKVTLRSVRQRVEKKKRRMNEIYRKRAMEALAIGENSNNSHENNQSNSNTARQLGSNIQLPASSSMKAHNSTFPG
jgi:predicted Holliday junction resolvase-like endonuclease